MNTPDYCREEFEAWHKAKVKEDGYYSEAIRDARWEGWCAALDNADVLVRNDTDQRKWCGDTLGGIPAGHAVLLTALPKKEQK